jgi:FMN-dependent oxidoreductase (nitrilotriacetate monooxygenase family)
MKRKLRLGAFMRPVGIHTGWWRYPGAAVDANFSWPKLKEYARKLERACFDAFFMADHLALMNMPMSALRRSATATSFDPSTLLPALAAVTERIGLIATASTTYDAPYHVARRFASLDHLSEGRAGWNLVTTVNPEAAMNFGLEHSLDHDVRYERAREFYDVVTGLWDSWADNAFVRDRDSGIFFDEHRLHTLNFQGKHFSVRGPLNVARPVQGWPVVALAGASDPARQLAAEAADVVFANSKTIASGREFYADVKQRMRKLGRDPDHLKILPGVHVVVGSTMEQAQRKKALLDSLVHVESQLPNLSVRLGMDVSRFDLDAPLPDIPDTNEGKGNRRELIDYGRRKNLTVRQLAEHCAQSGWGEMIGTPQQIADDMQLWLESDACDGFTVMFHTVPEGLNDFVEMVVPELQRRGLFRREYEGTTLRENLGLPRPSNRFFDTRTATR